MLTAAWLQATDGNELHIRKSKLEGWSKAKSKKKRAKSGSYKNCGKGPKTALIKYLFVFYIIIEKYKT
jgi:hypothetical protein